MIAEMYESIMSSGYMSPCHRHVLKNDSPLQLDDFYFANGVYSDIWRGSYHGNAVAVKVWRGASLSYSCRVKFVAQLAHELDKWKRLEHPNIVPFLGVVPGRGHLPSLVLPYHEHGHVMEYLARNPSADILHLLIGLSSALSYMHSSTPPVVHGDIKGSNVLVTSTGAACLSDIGTSTIPTPPDWTMANRDGARWMAPEVMDPGPGVDADFYPVTTASDVYSFSMTALEMFTQKVPYAHRRFYGGVVFDVVRGVRPPRPIAATAPQLTDEVWSLMEKGWHHNPEKRPSIVTVAAWLSLIDQLREHS